MDAGTVFLILILLIVALFALGIWNTVIAKRTQEAVVAISPARAKALVEGSFNGMLWAQAGGPGDINRRRRQMKVSLIVSVDIEATNDGRTHITAWVSSADTQYGLILGRGVRKPKSIIAMLENAQSTETAAA